MRILGADIPDDKKVEIALTYVLVLVELGRAKF